MHHGHGSARPQVSGPRYPSVLGGGEAQLHEPPPVHGPHSCCSAPASHIVAGAERAGNHNRLGTAGHIYPPPAHRQLRYGVLRQPH